MRVIFGKINICIKKKCIFFGILFCKVVKSVYICISKGDKTEFFVTRRYFPARRLVLILAAGADPKLLQENYYN